MLSLPVKGQFEQVLNARYLEQCGYGLECSELTSERLSGFCDRLPAFEEKLAGYRQDGNAELLEHLDELLAQVAAGALTRA
jgi:hypothetical protein